MFRRRAVGSWELRDSLSDRIVTIYEGRLTGEYPPDAAPEEVGVGMLGGMKQEIAG